MDSSFGALDALPAPAARNRRKARCWIYRPASQYALRLPGQPARNETLTVAAGDAWGLLVGPSDDVLPLQMY